MNKYVTLAGMVAIMTLVMVEPSFANTNAGDSIIKVMTSFFTGTGGKILALVLGVAGLWTWLVGQNTTLGITLIVGGIVMIYSPQIIQGVIDIGGGAVANMSGLTPTTAVPTATK